MLRNCFVPCDEYDGVEINLNCFLNSSCCASGTSEDTVDINDNDLHQESESKRKCKWKEQENN